MTHTCKQTVAGGWKLEDEEFDSSRTSLAKLGLRPSELHMTSSSKTQTRWHSMYLILVLFCFEMRTLAMLSKRALSSWAQIIFLTTLGTFSNEPFSLRLWLTPTNCPRM